MKRFSKRTWLPQPSYVLFGLVIVGLVLAIVYGLARPGRTDADKPPQQAVASASTSADPVATVEDKHESLSQLEARTRAFVQAFYDYNRSLTALSQRRAVRSLATPRFMRKTFFGLTDSQADQAIRSGKFQVHGSVQSIWPSEVYGQPPTVELPVVVTMTKTDETGSTIDRYDQLVRMTWIKRPTKGWLLDSLTQ
ncbi:MAG TPA: hypothetical protein VFG56_02920 [Candidatus Saccharimonadales bacterium]|nr:hypothetical protein [Candidatus Saccharimonadales bacterium]